MSIFYRYLPFNTCPKSRILLTGAILFFNCFSFTGTASGQGIFFISDTQAPLTSEKILLKAYRNEEARDTLFADIISQHPQNLFMLGDLESRGSDEKSWRPVSTFVSSLRKAGAHVYAVPGNHEYMGRSEGGIRIFEQQFPGSGLYGYSVAIDSVAIVMLNSNFGRLSENDYSGQQKWYKSEMDRLDKDTSIRAIIVCTHRAPYSNSKIVGSSREVEDNFVARFNDSPKTVLFITGHSHNLEYFSENKGKHFLVIGGGGGITQPLLPEEKRSHHDLLDQSTKPVYFYLKIEKRGRFIELTARGVKHDFRFFDLEIGRIPVL